MEGTKIKLSEKLGYGLGDFASNLIWASVGTFLTFFYTDTVGLSAAAIGTMFLIIRVLDAFIDIGIGVLVDRTKSKHGKARPWLKWLAIPFGLSGVLLFSAPDFTGTGALIYAYCTYLIINIAYSAINVPYGVLNTMITQDSYERSLLNIFRMTMAVLSSIIITVLTNPLVETLGGGRQGWMMTFVLYGMMSVILFWITYRSTQERVKPSVVQKSVSIKRGFKALLRNKYWAQLIGFKIIMNTGVAVATGINVYYAQYVLGDKNLVGLLGLTTFLPLLVGMLVVAPLIKKLGKRNAALVGIVVSLFGIVLMMVNPTNLTVVIIAMIIKSIGTVPVLATTYAMLADTVEYGEWKTGIRTEGLIYSGGSFGAKAGSGLGTALLGWLLAFGGYVGGQTAINETAMNSIRFMFIYLPLIFYVGMFVVLYFYKLDKQYPQIVKELEQAAGN
ncbi:MFS transporter [Paenibacillus sp. D2_2]|uniref:MFS transporter n=1 Tax=Paenibacillus sp. D2_2 TaxID=3073092 RepID=UPI0028163B8E|nr:MFS transporter [Paenibacillus sp. D2_2]WMT39699.1 MFS transporter [Paenibacillus sp. D2_2]